jgi:hypothetical protein
MTKGEGAKHTVSKRKTLAQYYRPIGTVSTMAPANDATGAEPQPLLNRPMDSLRKGR